MCWFGYFQFSRVAFLRFAFSGCKRLPWQASCADAAIGSPIGFNVRSAMWELGTDPEYGVIRAHPSLACFVTVGKWAVVKFL